MAIVKFGTTVVGIRKTLAGVTYSNGAAGPLARAWSPSAMPRTPKQTAQQALIATFAGMWSRLSYSDQGDWTALAASPPEVDRNSLGLQYFLTGLQWFTRVNTRLYLAGEPTSDTPPIGAAPSPPTSVSIAAAAGPPIDVLASFDAAPFAADPFGVFALKSGRGAGQGVAYSGFYAAAIANISGTSSLDLSAIVNSLFGQLTPGSQLWLRLAVQSSEGLRSMSVTAQCVIT